MGLNFDQMAKTETAVAPAQGQGQSAPRPKAKLWVNMGKNFTVPVDEHGNTEDVFVSVFGVAFDNLERPEPYVGKNPKMQAMNEAKIFMWDMIFDGAKAVASGTAEPIEGMDIEIRRVGEATVSAPGSNPMLEQIANSFKIGK